MAIDTLAYVKALEAAGVDRRAAEAHAEALTGHVLPDVATKTDIDQLKAAFKADFEQFRAETRAEIAASEQRLMLAIEKSAHQQSVRVFGMVFAIVGLLDAILFALLRIVR